MAGELVKSASYDTTTMAVPSAAELKEQPSRSVFRLLHSSDLHVGDPYQQMPPGEHLNTCICPVLAVHNTAASVGADVILLAGDTFDHPRIHREVIEKVLEVIAATAFTWILLPGNHDSWLPDSGALAATASVPNLHIISRSEGEMVRVRQVELGVWGRALKTHDGQSRPMYGIPARPAWARWYVVVAHGEYVGCEDFSDPGRYPPSSPISDREVAGSSADYVALGHRHAAEKVVAGAVQCQYSGAPLSLRGDSRQAVVVTFAARRVVDVDLVAVKRCAGGCGARCE